MAEESKELVPLVNTGGGTYVAGNVDTSGGDFVGRDKYEIHMPVPQTDAQTRRNQQILIDKVWKFWIEGVLEKTTTQSPWIELEKESQPAMVQSPWKNVIELPNQRIVSVPSEKPIEEIFEEAGRGLLILGEPGAGKTITLLELAKALLLHAKNDPSQPIPVILNLSQWGEHLFPFAEWVIQELNSKYQIPKKLGRKWLTGYNLLLLLDGLDEVSRSRQEACIQAINQFSQNYGLSGIAVCSRSNDYKELNTRLLMGMAIYLQPLTLQQVDLYLEQLGEPFDVVRETLRKDTALQELVRTPLFLNLLVVAYHDLPQGNFEKLRGEGQNITYKTIFDTYIWGMFRRKAFNPKQSKKTCKNLSILAEKMSRNNIIVFQLDDLQPSWMKNSISRWIYFSITRLVISLFVCSIGSIVNMVIFAYVWTGIAFLAIFPIYSLIPAILFTLLEYWKFTKGKLIVKDHIEILVRKNFPAYIVASMIASICIFIASYFDLLNHPQTNEVLPSGLSAGLVASIYTAIINFGLALLLFRLYYWSDNWWQNFIDIKFADQLSWSWSNAKKNGIKGFFGGLLIMGPISLIGKLIYGIDVEIKSEGIMFTIIYLIIVGVYTGFVYGLPLGTLGFLFGGLKPYSIPEKHSPSVSLWTSFINSLLGGLYVTLIVVLFSEYWDLTHDSYVSPSFTNFGVTDLEYIFIIGGIVYLLSLPFFGGIDFLKHWILRIICAITNMLPFRLIYFLDNATDLIFLRKVGGGYIFVHRLLQEHFAKLDVESFEGGFDG